MLQKEFVLQHSLKVTKQGGPNKLRGEKIEKLISVPPFIRHEEFNWNLMLLGTEEFNWNLML